MRKGCRFFVFFPECLARVPVSLRGFGAWGCVRQTFGNRPQPSATVRVWALWPCLWRVLQKKKVPFGGFKRCVASFRVAGMALCDIPTCFIFVENRFCAAGAMLPRRFQKMSCSFRGRRSTLETSIVISRGGRNTSGLSCWVFFANRIVRAASSGDKVQIPWQAWHYVRCAENWRSPCTKDRF